MKILIVVDKQEDFVNRAFGSDAAKHVSMYYDVVQKLKTVMEETHYGQNL